MRFYRPLGQISALTFDLDDTLYDNRPVIDRTMHESLAFVRSYHPSLSQFDAHELNQLRQTLLASEPEIYHDVTEWRRRALELGMLTPGSPPRGESGGRCGDGKLRPLAQPIDVPQETHDTLAKLAEKWPLVAITNGNAQPELFGLSDYFRFVLRAGPDGRSKPFADMYHLAAERLNLPLGRFCTSAMI
jgi:putative hydrolase of the HAD superfamily